jgi:hypothetical protein
VKIARSLSICLFAVLVLFGGLAGSANAARVKQVSARHYRPQKKNLGPYGGKYLAPKKQHPVKDRYRSPVSGNTLYGKPVKPKH